MAPRLAGSTSTYLAQHADQPVDWWPWSAEAFAEAGRRDVPVLLSVWYASCHWCHVMARESFADPVTARQLNEGYVAIKVDREERPDVDAVYMNATQALTGGRLADDLLLDRGCQALLRRHLFSARAGLGSALLQAAVGRHLAGLGPVSYTHLT